MTPVDAVVVSYRSAARLANLLPALRGDPLIGAIVVVDHGDDDSADVSRSFGAQVVRDPTNPGFGAGQNRGVGLTTGETVLLVNPDLVPERGAIQTGLDLLQERPEAAAVQGVIRSESDGAPERSAGRSLGPVHLWGRLLRLRRLLDLPVAGSLARRRPALRDHLERVAPTATRVESLAATMLLVRRQAFEEIGGFDPDFFLYGEDLDLCARWRAAGWELWTVPDTWARHASGASSAGRWDRELVWWEGTMRFAALHWQTAAFGAGIVAAGVRAVTLSVRRPTATRSAMRRLVVAPVSARRRRR